MVTITARPRIRTALASLLVAGFLAGPLGGDPANAFDTRERVAKRLINKERVARGLPRLRFYYRLERITNRHTRRMAQANQLFHNSRLAQQAADIPWSILGENVGVGMSVESLHRAFMNSKAHRDNVLRRRFKRVSISAMSAHGRTWITVVFAG